MADAVIKAGHIFSEIAFFYSLVMHPQYERRREPFRYSSVRPFDKVAATYADNVLTYDLRLPNWPFFALAWAGDVSAVLLIAIRTYRLVFWPELIVAREPTIKPVE